MSWFRNRGAIYDEPIAAVLIEMRENGPLSPEYPDLLNKLETLTAMQDNSRLRRLPKPDTMLAVAGNLVGVLMIVAYEQKHVFNSKAMSFVRSNPT